MDNRKTGIQKKRTWGTLAIEERARRAVPLREERGPNLPRRHLFERPQPLF
jgi:hypothetical protein